jgi:hypothetical protein
MKGKVSGNANGYRRMLSVLSLVSLGLWMICVMLSMASANPPPTPPSNLDKPSDHFALGQQMGKAGLGQMTGMSQSQAQQMIPTYGQPVPQQQLYKSTNLNTAGELAATACTQNDKDPSCQAINTTRTVSTTRPKYEINRNSPLLNATKPEANSSINALLTGNYSQCKTEQVTKPAIWTTETCNASHAIEDKTCTKSLNVTVTNRDSCDAGSVIASGKVNRNSLDAMTASVSCQIRANQTVPVTVYAYGGQGACIGAQTIDMDVTQDIQQMPTQLTQLAPHWNGSCQNLQVYQSGPACTGDYCQRDIWMIQRSTSCSGNAEEGRTCSEVYAGGFNPNYAPCPAGTIQGDLLQDCSGNQDYYTCTPRSSLACYANQWSRVDQIVAMRQRLSGFTPSGEVFRMSLNFIRPRIIQTISDSWDNQCGTLEGATQ